MYDSNNKDVAYAHINCVPFKRASPSLDNSFTGLRLNFFNIVELLKTFPLCSTFPLPIRGSEKCANGAKSPDAPNEP